MAVALVGFQGLILTWASETRNAFIRLLKNKGFKEDTGRTNRVVRHGFIHDPGIQQEPRTECQPKPIRVCKQTRLALQAATYRGSPGRDGATRRHLRPRAMAGRAGAASGLPPLAVEWIARSRGMPPTIRHSAQFVKVQLVSIRVKDLLLYHIVMYYYTII